jgi:DNA-binding transcriptional regulator LsrR (DeoR family)
MKEDDGRMDYDKARLFSRILTMHYIEQHNQSDISRMLGLSTAKVNRIIRQARDEGYLEINIRTPFQSLFDLEQRLTSLVDIPEVLVCPTLSDDPNTVIRTMGATAADYLLQHLRDGDVLCISGGKQVTEIVNALNPQRKFDVTVVPATGGVQGKHYTDVNHLAMELAKRLGGKALQLHAPLFADSVEERNMLMNMRQTREVLDQARHADIALMGIGSIVPDSSSYFDLRSMSESDRKQLIEQGATGDVFAHLFDVNGKTVGQEHNEKLVGLTLSELRDIPLSVGVAASGNKVSPILGALRGHFFKALITDEVTTKQVLKLLEKGVRT